MARPPSVRLVDPPWFELAKSVLADTPNLTGAACTGRHTVFDPIDHDTESPGTVAARHAEAERICRQCPVLDLCRTAWVDTPGVRWRPDGVVGGRTPAQRRRRGRPIKEAS
ncbi:hypothetical protein nbrc107696_01460 [Gordonia spumicola]|uniref:4Fe-4S Wbl-type domain-containing protein n=1 Tax=Gordonia spumicola TaxID=589161 RepID=A0A7I9V3U7_9ACTN|nr:WhiB family transcriptional regulator [Gordonia spumicola]GED99699.1 hypothetical protein nbrc107696_01460 [Gordonia spumicola]